ncbi:Exportin-2, partial [Symbiodinium microadriaticum]
DTVLELPGCFQNLDGSKAYVILEKAIYGLRSAGLSWQKHLAGLLAELGLFPSLIEPTLYKGYWGDILVLCLVYVDDILLATRSKETNQQLLDFLTGRLKVKLTGRLEEDGRIGFLGREIIKRGHDILLAVKKECVESIFEAFGWNREARRKMKACTVPPDLRSVLDKEDPAKPSEELSPEAASRYRSTLGKLGWLVQTRGDLCYYHSLLSRGQSCPRAVHEECMRKVLRWLLEVPDLVQVFQKDFEAEPGKATLSGYSDANWASERSTGRKSTSGGVIYLNGKCIKTYSRLQPIVALSSAESELFAMVEMARELIGFGQLISHVFDHVTSPLDLATDSASARQVSMMSGFLRRMRHVDLRLCFLQDKVENGELLVQHVPGTDNEADLQTKNLSATQTWYHIVQLGLEERLTRSVFLSGDALPVSCQQLPGSPPAEATALVRPFSEGGFEAFEAFEGVGLVCGSRCCNTLLQLRHDNSTRFPNVTSLRFAAPGMAVSPAQMGQLAQLLTQTVAGNMQAMKAAEQQLRSAEVQPGFGLVLLELLRSGSVEAAARQAGAIYFKNYIRRQWCVEGAGGISASDRQAIKQHILSLMLQAPKQVQVQLSAGLEEISITDYPAEWQSLLPEIVQHLKSSQDMSVLKGTMQTAHTVFLKFRAQARSEDLLREVKYTVEGFQETHLAVFTATCRQVLAGGLAADQLIAHFELLLATIGAFFSLNVIDLPEFFEDHREDYFRGFLELLKFQHEAVAGKEQQGLLEQVKGAICECLVLYAEKYQEEFMPFLLPCVNEVWSLLVGLDQQEKNDQLVAKGIQFLSSTAATHWPQSPFEDPNVLSGICEKVVFPNVLLRDSDVELFEDNPLEYVRRDMEAADQETRRRSSMDLVKAMGRLNEAKVTEILIGYVKALMSKAASAGAGEAERFKDACIFLCIAMAVREQTHREGVTVTNQNVNVLDFFTSLVAPELTAEPLSQRPVLRASCLKFVTVFRNQLPREQVGQVLPAICSHITAESAVVHTYAAICIEKLLRVRDATPQALPHITALLVIQSCSKPFKQLEPLPLQSTFET